MFLDLTVQGSNGSVAKARLFLNYHTKAAILIPSLGWPKTFMKTSMTMFRGTNGVMYLENEDTSRFGDGHGLTLDASPESEQDETHLQGTGRMRSKESQDFNTAKISWKIPELSALRKEIQGIIKKIGLTKNPADKRSFPNGPPSAKTIEAAKAVWEKTHPPDKPYPKFKKVTNCGELPGHILNQVGGDVPKDVSSGVTMTNNSADKNFLKATGNMTQWKEYAQRVETLRNTTGTLWHPWTPACGAPRPGDVYVLTNKQGGSHFEHVGIIAETGGQIWTCADAGQTIGDEPVVDGVQQTGYSACLRNRAYDATKGTVQMLGVDAKIKQSDTGTRFLMGWVDVDVLFQRISP